MKLDGNLFLGGKLVPCREGWGADLSSHTNFGSVTHTFPPKSHTHTPKVLFSHTFPGVRIIEVWKKIPCLVWNSIPFSSAGLHFFFTILCSEVDRSGGGGGGGGGGGNWGRLWDLIWELHLCPPPPTLGLIPADDLPHTVIAPHCRRLEVKG